LTETGRKLQLLLGKNENIMMNRTLSFGGKLLVDDDEIIHQCVIDDDTILKCSLSTVMIEHNT